jgi:hypothetical protein
VILIPTDYGFLCLVFLFIGAPMVFFMFYTLLAVANAGHLALALVKWFGDMRALSSGAKAHA